MYPENRLKFNLTVFGLVGLVIVFILFLITGPVALIGPGERGVVIERGRVTGRVFTEGWYLYNSLWKDVVKFDTKTQLDVARAAAASQDLQDVNAEIAVQYRINSDKVAEIVRTIGHQSEVTTKIIDPAVQETVKASTALFPVADIIQQRPVLKAKIEELLAARLATYGVVLEEISIKDITFSNEFSKAVEQKQIAEQRKRQAEFEAQARIAEAEGKAKEQELLTQNLTETVLKRLWIEKWSGQVPQVVGGNNPLIFQIPN